MNLFKIETEVEDQGSIVNCKAGFTLIEMLVVLAIMSVLLAMAYSALRTPNEQIACKEIYSQLQLEKMKAVATGNDTSPPLNIDTVLNSVEKVAVPEEVTYQTTAVTAPPGWVAFPLAFGGIDFDGAGGTQVTFTPKGMITNVGGSVYLYDVNDTTKLCAVSVLTTGLVKMATSNDGGANWN